MPKLVTQYVQEGDVRSTELGLVSLVLSLTRAGNVYHTPTGLFRNS